MKTFDVQVIYNREIMADSREEARDIAISEIESSYPEALRPDVIDIYEVEEIDG